MRYQRSGLPGSDSRVSRRAWKGRFRALVACLAVTAVAGNVAADDVSGARNLLCTVLETHVCVDTSGCAKALAEDLNIPRFIRLDTKTGKLSTTPASGENRETKAESVRRENGQIVLQGVEQGRLFSLLIQESTGLSTFASASDGSSLTVFGACTPASSN